MTTVGVAFKTANNKSFQIALNELNLKQINVINLNIDTLLLQKTNLPNFFLNTSKRRQLFQI